MYAEPAHALQTVKKTTAAPKVSVCVITYNQEKYINQCLQSIIDQKFDFDIEIIVADDCSTDSTQQLIKDFAERYPNTIKPVLHQNNIGVALNYRSAHDIARGEYVAHCDGDDFWLPGKLAFQTKLLDENPEASQCWCSANLVDDHGAKIGVFPSRIARFLYPEKITASHIAMSYALVGQHSTQIYRRKFKFNFDAAQPTLDFWIAFNVSLNGPSIYSKKILSAYRMTTAPSITRTQSPRRATVDLLSAHLNQIIKDNPIYAKEAKSNMIARFMLSKIKKHETKTIEEYLQKNKKQSAKMLMIVKSLYFFALQKIRY